MRFDKQQSLAEFCAKLSLCTIKMREVLKWALSKRLDRENAVSANIGSPYLIGKRNALVETFKVSKIHRGEPLKFARRRQRLPFPCRKKRTTVECYNPSTPFRSHAFAKRTLHVKRPSFGDVTPTERTELLLRRQLSQ